MKKKPLQIETAQNSIPKAQNIPKDGHSKNQAKSKKENLLKNLTSKKNYSIEMT